VYLDKIFEKFKNILLSIRKKGSLTEGLIDIGENTFIHFYYREYLEYGGIADTEKFNDHAPCRIMFKEGTDITEVVKFLTSNMHIEKKNDKSLSLIYNGPQGPSTKKVPINCIKIDFNKHYNFDFKPISDIIVNRLNTKKEKGIVLLHGKPGTGKTSYLRWLINQGIDKNILYVPSELSYQLTSPHFIPFLMDNKDSILVIEEAENILSSRDSGRNEAVSNLLNLSDGLLSDCLNIQIVATFNTNLQNIDEALLRKGRLIAKYEFLELSLDRTNFLLKELGMEESFKTMTLSDIYNTKELTFSASKKPIGFKN